MNSDSEPIGPIESASATIMIDLDEPNRGAETVVFGIVEYLFLATEFRDYGPSFVLLPAGDWTVRIEIVEPAMTLFGGEAPAILLAGIEVSATPRVLVDVPELTLAPPFRWASDTEGPTPMEVSTAELVVRRGCGISALSCGGTRGIQVMARGATTANPGDDGVVSIDSWNVARPAADDFYLDPGPLEFRSEPHLIWTGREMIVWGGRTDFDNYQQTFLAGGAAFDPVKSEWRVLPAPPLQGPDLTAVVWADDRMILISRQATLAYDPDSDEWTRLGDGPQYGPKSPGLTVWTGEVVATWAPLGIRVLDPVNGMWTTLPDPGFGGPDLWAGALQVIDGRLYAVGWGPVVAEWTGSEWRQLPVPPEVSNSTMEPGPSARQSGVAGGRLIIWGGDAAFAYDPAADSWSQIAAPPFSSSLVWDVGLFEMGERLLAPLGHDALVYDDRTDQMVRVSSVIYDGATDRWEPVVLPGDGNEIQMVWTGEEILSWGGCCGGSVADAWRWQPPGG